MIKRTLKTAQLIDGFWDRWLAHGVSREAIVQVRKNLNSLQSWVPNWLEFAIRKEEEAREYLSKQLCDAASRSFLEASLYYNLIQWIFPDNGPDKKKWYRECLRVFRAADELAKHDVFYEEIEVSGYSCAGRISIPKNAEACIIIINPIDSTKEELFLYEKDFVEAGYMVVSFDGPGQGQTYTINGLRGTKLRWEQFIDRLIRFSFDLGSGIPLYLFGSSLGASWAIYGSTYPQINKTVAVSPAVTFETLNLPTYFLERMDYSCTLVPEQRAIPDFDKLNYSSPVCIHHGTSDQMVPTQDVYGLYTRPKALN